MVRSVKHSQVVQDFLLQWWKSQPILSIGYGCIILTGPSIKISSDFNVFYRWTDPKIFTNVNVNEMNPYSRVRGIYFMVKGVPRDTF